ncbi:MAG: GGDEF domain-containing protein [Nitrospirae bacterium]|nr:GGDEF domain-containing protein [Nitrospirota bacterium]
MQNLNSIKIDWLYPLKKKIIIGILGILTFSVIATMIFIALMLRSSLINDSKDKTQELSNAIQSSLSSLMLMRDPDMIQGTIENIGKNNHSLIKAFILDKTGRIAYSSDKSEIGKVLDKYHEQSCHACHQKIDAAPPETTIIINTNGTRVHRNVRVIYNETACYGCHLKSDRINGKLIIDRSLKQTYSLITSIGLIIFGSGLVCLIFLVPFLSKVLSKGMDKYINKIVRQNSELTLLYVMIERLSKTIDLEELKAIVFEIVKDTLGADEMDIILPKPNKEYSITAWSRSTGKIVRRKIDTGDPLLLIINDWMDGKIKDEKISDDRKQIYMPIEKSSAHLALLVVRKTDVSFDPVRLGLIGIMSSHISVAFENARLYYIAITDELTHLYTQRHFRYCIDKKFLDYEKYGEKITLLMMDIDDFKKVNDTYGHMAGDSVIKEVANIIMASVRDNDLAFRYGGEEFAVILPSTGIEGGKHVAERIRESIASAVFEKGTHNLKETISIGVSICPDNAKSVRDLILTADQALYKAKQTGKNKVVVNEVGPWS